MKGKTPGFEGLVTPLLAPISALETPKTTVNSKEVQGQR